MVPATIAEAVGFEINTAGAVVSLRFIATADTALYALILPHPKLESKPTAPRSSELLCINETSEEADNPGLTASIRAPTPAVIGEEKEVPDQNPYPPWLVIGIDSPGAATSIQLPKFEKLESVSDE